MKTNKPEKKIPFLKGFTQEISYCLSQYVLGPFLSLSGLDSSGGSHFLCCCKEVETHLCFK